MSDSVRSEVLAGLKAALESIQGDDTYPIKIQDISEFEESTLTVESNALLMIIDTGHEELQAKDDTHYRYSVEVDTIGYVQSDTMEGLPVQLNNMVAGIKKFIDETAGSAIHASCKAIQYLSGEIIRYDKSTGRIKPRGGVNIRAQLIYVCEAGTF